MKLHIIPLLLLAGCTAIPSKMTLREGENWASRKEYANFELCGQARTEADAQALVRFCQADGREGYEVLLHNGPADIYANPTFLPDEMQPAYDHYWTAERVDRILDVLARYRIALEINPRYRIPGFDIIRRAKERGIKFTFGTNNVDDDFGTAEEFTNISMGSNMGNCNRVHRTKRHARFITIQPCYQTNNPCLKRRNTTPAETL